MNYLVDTNVISELRKGQQCNPNVAGWYGNVRDNELFLSVLVLGEIQKGVEKIRSRDPVRAKAIQAWLESLLSSFGDRVLPVTDQIAPRWGCLSAGRPVPVIDCLLAATAWAHGLMLVTRNVNDFSTFGIPVIDPFAA